MKLNQPTYRFAALTVLLLFGLALPAHAEPAAGSADLISSLKNTVLSWIGPLQSLESSDSEDDTEETDDEAGVDIEPNG
ncbi:MAG: hypothetical protein MPN21_07570 [Thermoanaerobaculia bacterium]|nr:hypothetical protein [Thermoanaerobaculia bacterium]